MENCPQCGKPTEQFHEGYCEACCSENQRTLDEHNASFDRWQSMTEMEREREIAREGWQ